MTRKWRSSRSAGIASITSSRSSHISYGDVLSCIEQTALPSDCQFLTSCICDQSTVIHMTSFICFTLPSTQYKLTCFTVVRSPIWDCVFLVEGRKESRQAPRIIWRGKLTSSKKSLFQSDLTILYSPIVTVRMFRHLKEVNKAVFRTNRSCWPFRLYCPHFPKSRKRTIDLSGANPFLYSFFCLELHVQHLWRTDHQWRPNPPHRRQKPPAKFREAC